MIEVDVWIVGALSKPTGESAFRTECEEGCPVRALLEQIGYRPMHIPYIVAAVDGEVRRHSYPLTDGAAVVLSITVGGG